MECWYQNYGLIIILDFNLVLWVYILIDLLRGDNLKFWKSHI